MPLHRNQLLNICIQKFISLATSWFMIQLWMKWNLLAPYSFGCLVYVFSQRCLMFVQLIIFIYLTRCIWQPCAVACKTIYIQFSTGMLCISCDFVQSSSCPFYFFLENVSCWTSFDFYFWIFLLQSNDSSDSMHPLIQCIHSCLNFRFIFSLLLKKK